jgi:hypothetical protein
MGCAEFNEKHIAAHLVDMLPDAVREWTIDNKTVGIVTDSAANIFSAVHVSKWQHIPCYDHTLNLKYSVLFVVSCELRWWHGAELRRGEGRLTSLEDCL